MKKPRVPTMNFGSQVKDIHCEEKKATEEIEGFLRDHWQYLHPCIMIQNTLHRLHDWSMHNGAGV